MVALPEGVIHIDVLCRVHQLVEQLVADWGRVLLLRTLVLLKALVGRGTYDTVPVTHLDVLVLIIEVIVSDTIANDPALKVGNV